jgi:hypothetical protein
LLKKTTRDKQQESPAQRILVEDDVYGGFIDRAIAEVCVRSDGEVDFRVPHLPLQRIGRYG